MNCPGCGAQNASDARFCNMCGGRIAAETPLSNPPAIRSTSTLSTSGLRGAPDPMSSTQSVSLSAIGVQSSGRTYAVIGVAAAALVSAGALGMWLYGRSSPAPVAVDALPPPPANSPVVIGTPLPVGEEPPPVDFATGSRRRPSKGTAARTSGRVAPPGTSAGTVAAGRSGTTAPRSATTSGRTGTTTRATGRTTGGTATAPRTGGGESGSGGAATGADTTGGGAAGGGDTGGGAAGGDPPGGGTGGGTDTIPADTGDERDIAAELYAGQVRRVIRQFYAARAQACFEHASRNTEIRGTVIVTFTIAPSGQVSHAAAQRNTTGDEALGRCLAGEVGTWRLPAPGAEPVEMSIPFSR